MSIICFMLFSDIKFDSREDYLYCIILAMIMLVY